MSWWYEFPDSHIWTGPVSAMHTGVTSSSSGKVPKNIYVDNGVTMRRVSRMKRRVNNQTELCWEYPKFKYVKGYIENPPSQGRVYARLDYYFSSKIFTPWLASRNYRFKFTFYNTFYDPGKKYFPEQYDAIKGYNGNSFNYNDSINWLSVNGISEGAYLSEARRPTRNPLKINILAGAGLVGSRNSGYLKKVVKSTSTYNNPAVLDIYRGNDKKDNLARVSGLTGPEDIFTIGSNISFEYTINSGKLGSVISESDLFLTFTPDGRAANIVQTIGQWHKTIYPTGMNIKVNFV